MAIYLVRARPKKEHLASLQKELDSGRIAKLRPFGEALHAGLENARIDAGNPDYALWVEEDYCSPPLAMERESVLDRYFDDITVKPVETEQKGWNSISGKPRLLT